MENAWKMEGSKFLRASWKPAFSLDVAKTLRLNGGHNFGLKHTFEKYITNEESCLNILTHKRRKIIDQSTTRNIMDYIPTTDPISLRNYFFVYQITYLKTR
jgi:hypothetical protein